MSDLIDHFRQNHLPVLNAELDALREKNIDDVISLSAEARQPNGKRHLHHTWKKKEPLYEAIGHFNAYKSRFLSCRSFEAILILVEQIAAKTGGLGELYAYDSALTVGAKRGFMPSEVYLHAGTRDGAKALNLEWRKRSVPVPQRLKSLEPYQVEDFLCIYKKWLRPSMLND